MKTSSFHTVFNNVTSLIACCTIFLNCQKAVLIDKNKATEALPTSILKLTNWNITIPFEKDDESSIKVFES